MGSTRLTDRQPSLNELRVLVVEDEPDARELIGFILTEGGAEVIAVRSADEALAEMERGRFDVLVLT
jgi:CheY-like chemotaxis protein